MPRYTVKHAFSILICFLFFTSSANALLKAEVDLQPCHVYEIPDPARRGSYPVYEDRAHATGRKLALNIIVVPAVDQAHAGLPIFWLEGGPGGASTASAAVVSMKWLAGSHRDHDLVFVDERGTGKSEPLRCGDYGENSDDIDRFFGTPLIAKDLAACRDHLEKGADLRFYTTFACR